MSTDSLSSLAQKDQFLTAETLTCTGFVTAGGQNYPYVNQLNLREKSTEERIALAATSELLSAEAGVEAYCDLLLNKDYEDECLTDIFMKIRSYYDSHTDISENLRNKIETVLRRPDTPNTARSVPTYTSKATYTSGFFTVHYETAGAYAISATTASQVAAHFNSAYQTLRNTYGFRQPRLESGKCTLQVYLSPSSGSAYTQGVEKINNTYASYIVILGFTSAGSFSTLKKDQL